MTPHFRKPTWSTKSRKAATAAQAVSAALNRISLREESSRAKFCTLPQEIYDNIFAWLTVEDQLSDRENGYLTAYKVNSDLRNISITSRVLHHAVEAALYFEVTDTAKDTCNYRNYEPLYLQQILRTAMAKSHLASLVKVFNIFPWDFLLKRSFDMNATLDEEKRSVLLALLPLQAGDGETFLSGLRPTDDDAELFLLLRLLSNLSHLRIVDLWRITGRELWYQLLKFSSSMGTLAHLKCLTILPYQGYQSMGSTPTLISLDVLLAMLVLPGLETFVASLDLMADLWRGQGRSVAKSHVKHIELQYCTIRSPHKVDVFGAFIDGFSALESIRLQDIQISRPNTWSNVRNMDWHDIVRGLSSQHEHLTTLTLVPGLWEYELDPIPLLSSFGCLRYLHVPLTMITGWTQEWSQGAPMNKTRLADSLPESIEELVLDQCNPFALYGGMLEPVLNARRSHDRLQNLQHVTTTLAAPQGAWDTFTFPFAMCAGSNDYGMIMNYPADQPGWLDDLMSLPLEDQSLTREVSHRAGIYFESSDTARYDPYHLMKVLYGSMPIQHSKLAKGFEEVGVRWTCPYNVARLWPDKLYNWDTEERLDRRWEENNDWYRDPTKPVLKIGDWDDTVEIENHPLGGW